MSTAPLNWQAHEAADYHRKMRARCDHLLRNIISDPSLRSSILSDPRALHRELFEEFAPPEYSEYAGTYRGTPGTSLLNRSINAQSQVDPSKTYGFVPPTSVSPRMETLIQTIQTYKAEVKVDDRWGKLLLVTYAFCWFGKIHPFLDGNGHVQRAYFAALASELGLLISSRFAIHPRPYDRLLAYALERFTTAPNDNCNDELPLVAEYLGFFLDGEFNLPRAHLVSDIPEN